jgi:hypothetical protein
MTRHLDPGFDAWPEAFNRPIPTRRLTWDEAFEEELSSPRSIDVLRPPATIIDVWRFDNHGFIAVLPGRQPVGSSRPAISRPRGSQLSPNRNEIEG